jgi:hypothetical protein
MVTEDFIFKSPHAAKILKKTVMTLTLTPGCRKIIVFNLRLHNLYYSMLVICSCLIEIGQLILDMPTSFGVSWLIFLICITINKYDQFTASARENKG